MTHSTDPHSPGLVQLTGPALFLTRDPDLRLAQLTNPGSIDYELLLDEPLLDNISTDEIIPGWCCYWYDEKLGDYAYLGLRDGVVGEGSVRSLHPQVVVSGASKGCGSSREHAVYAERFAGIAIVFADSFEKIYEQNCRNVGIVTCDDRDILRALLAGDALPLSAFTQRLNAIERTIIDAGGLFKFNSRHRESPSLTVELGPERPMNCVEKIIQRHLPAGPSPTGCVVVGESYFVTADVRFSHEYVTPMAAGMFDNEFGTDAPLADPSSCLFFQDHLSLASNVLARRPNGAQLTDRVNRLHRRQYEFATDKGGLFVGTLPTGGSEAICHNYILEKVARPGQIVIGTDSHTCTAGAVGAFAFGVGATDIANAWYSREILVKVPEIVRINLHGVMRPGVCAKDAMLTLLAAPAVHGGVTRGRVLLFSGPGCAALTMDERATLCNMAVEARGITGCFESDDADFGSDRDAVYAANISLDLGAVEPMVALPGDPLNSVPLNSVRTAIRVTRAYGGSCTGGKAADMDMYANVLGRARELGMTVAPGVDAFIQMGSIAVYQYATEMGYVALFEQVGATVLPPSCGACINAGPGVSESPDDVTVSAQNRNFPGRSGPGAVYLASPFVVAASAVAGRLCSPAELFEQQDASCG